MGGQQLSRALDLNVHSLLRRKLCVGIFFEASSGHMHSCASCLRGPDCGCALKSASALTESAGGEG